MECSFISSIAPSFSIASFSMKPPPATMPITRSALVCFAGRCWIAANSSACRMFSISTVGRPAFFAVLLRTIYYFDPVLKNVACLLTIHNSDRQGWFPRETVEKLLLPWDVYTVEREPDVLRALLTS